MRIAAVLLALVILGVGACDQPQGNRQPSAGTGSSPSISATLRVGVVTAPPITSIDASTLKPKGYAVDLLQALEQRGALKFETQAVDWANIATALNSGRVDFIAGPIFQTEARAKAMLFTDALWTYAIVAVKRADNETIKTREDVVNGRLRIAVGRGGFDHEFATRQMRNADIRVLPAEQPDGAMLEILAKRTDIALVDQATANRFLRNHPELALVADGEPVSMQLAGFVVGGNNWRLRDFLNVALQNLAVSGEMRTLAQPYAAANAWHGLPLVERFEPRRTRQ